ncbi:MAG: urease accessory protein UreD [Hormoscilla sp. SP12CHS1]|nr:urease accessory protein UreD [Hormoscilla sp. SP12CHS1]
MVFGSHQQWYGRLILEFPVRHGKTQLLPHMATAPLKVLRPFYPEGADVCHAVILHTAGGVVGGDRLRVDLNLKPAAHSLITTPAATKIYRSNGLYSQQTIQIQVGTGATLEWLPQETIVFNGAAYRQDLRVELAEGASWLGWEITRFGRTARGERFTRGEWRSHVEIWQQGRPLWIDRQLVKGGSGMLESINGLAGQPVVGTFSLLGQPATPEVVEKTRTSMGAQVHQGLAGVTRLADGLLCRYRGASTAEARQWFTQVWHLVRLHYYRRPAQKPRVWY